ncbi:MRN complex-interacting protein [Solenopsis invicta]|uniref:MRN complex-interacting protein n=1 Tax=Solenopsis invicta TaxID=13686 RepID=UPI000E33F5C0|nr:MRN complex-interacting protein [Solenopsis invicta]
MPQDMNILCCYSCKMYQVHIVKKARKWQCKLCNAKQSIRKVYFQGSGKDCRLHVQHLNSLKTNDTSFFLHSEQEDSNNSATSIAQESDINTLVESKQAKYLDSPEKKNSFDAEDLSSDNIHEIEDMTNEKSVCNAVNNEFCNFGNSVDYFESENIVDNTEKLCATNFNYNLSNENKCNLQDNDKLSKNRDIVANIFETYSELDDPLDI